MNYLIEWLLQPMGLIASLLILTLLSWCLYGAKPRLPFLFFCMGTFSLLLVSMPVISNALVWKFENSRDNPAICSDAKPNHLVVLGGGIDLYVPSESPYELLNSDSIIRTLRAPEFATSDTNYYLLGGGDSDHTLGETMQQVLIAQGVSADKITIETQSKSTHENAQQLSDILPPSETSNITLLTSQLHVARAAATFEKNGYTVCHIGVDTQYSVPALPVSLLPYLSGLNKSTFVFHEWMALTVYRLKGYL